MSGNRNYDFLVSSTLPFPVAYLKEQTTALSQPLVTTTYRLALGCLEMGTKRALNGHSKCSRPDEFEGKN